MSDYREECIHRKNVQRGIADERPVSGRKHQERKPFLIENHLWGTWCWRGRYAGEKTANQAFDSFTRKHPRWGWRLIKDGEVIRSFDATEGRTQ